MTPTTRCAWLLAAVAVVGLLLPTWVAVTAALALLAATLADGLSVRSAPQVKRKVDEVLSRGVPAALSVAAFTGDSRQVLLRQPATPALAVHGEHGRQELLGEVTPVRRGRHTLPGVASASVGPLGLARWHHRSGEPTELLVYPDLQTARRLVLRLRAGVCQDFSHVMIAGLRALGLPARYVSGYIRTRPPPGRVARRGADQSHAWVGAWLGPEHGWIGLDPTNDVVVQDEHVVLGWGRDYGDVSPVRGVLLGGGSHKLSVSVDLEAV